MDIARITTRKAALSAPPFATPSCRHLRAAGGSGTVGYRRHRWRRGTAGWLVARMRTIKPETFTSETLAAISVHARWTFAGLWTYCDDDGRGRSDPRLIKAAIWPLDDDVTAKDVAAHLDELEAKALICRYQADGKSYLHVVNFGEHQKPNRPLPSKLPRCTRRTHGGLSEDSVKVREHVMPPSGEAHSGTDPATPDANQDNSGAVSQGGDELAGRAAFTEESVSTHGDGSQTSSTNTPTPTSVRREGDGEGDGEVEGQDQKAPAKPPPREDVERLCVHLADRIEANGSNRPNITVKWRDAARLMLDLDKRTEGQVHTAIDWCQDDEFWRINVMSMPKLREQYEKLRLAALKDQRGRGSPGRPNGIR